MADFGARKSKQLLQRHFNQSSIHSDSKSFSVENKKCWLLFAISCFSLPIDPPVSNGGQLVDQ